MAYIEFVHIERPSCTVRVPKDLLTDEQIKQLTRDLSVIFPDEPKKSEGVWVVLYYDRSGIAIFDKEIDALRYCVNNNYDDVVFWEFGKNWHDVTMKPKSQ